MQAVLVERVAQRLGHVALPHHVLETARAVLAGKGEIAHAASLARESRLRPRLESPAMTLGTRRALFIALQVLVLAAFAFAIEHWWGFERLLAPWQQVPLTLVLLAIVTQAASYGLRALRVYLAEPRVPRGLGGWARCLQLALLNNALNLLLP